MISDTTITTLFSMKYQYIHTNETSSTHLDALALLREKDRFYCIHTNHQTSGIGQGCKSFIDIPNTALLVTFCIPLEYVEKKDYAPSLFTSLFSLVTAGKPSVKSPNDFMINGVKCGGSLTYISQHHNILSVGINVIETPILVDNRQATTCINDHSKIKHTPKYILSKALNFLTNDICGSNIER